MRVRPTLFLIAILSLGAIVGARAALAQGAPRAGEPDVPEKVGKDLRAFHLTGDPPRIDGRIDDAVWSAAEVRDDFIQNEPDNLQPPTERTTFQVAYDDRNIYIAVRCFTRDTSDITAGLGRRDNMPPSDALYISFDPRHDHLTAYTFVVNPSGVQSDWTFFDDTKQSLDYDGVWEVETAITAQGWDAEFRIPFSQMRFNVPPGDEAVWGFTVRRDIHKRGEIIRWVPAPRGTVGFVSRLGHLVFGERLTPPRRLEITPFTLARREAPSVGPAENYVEGGIDLRMGLGPSISLSATVNPDFAQVEQDPAVLNLSIFETFLPEKRPFFLEDSRIFVLPYAQFPLFNSRRIGRTPNRYALHAGDSLISRPDQTTIIGAAKLTGKGAGWTYGALTALTAAEHATVAVKDSNGTVTRMNRPIEPQTSYSVARVQRDILGGSSNIGAIATAVVREKDLDAYTGGVDYNIRWAGNRFNWNGHWAGTRAPISGVERSGIGGASALVYTGKYLGVNGRVDYFGRDFRNTDIGFLSTRVNKTTVGAGFSLTQPDPWKSFRSLQGNLGVGRSWNGDGLVFDKSLDVGGVFQLQSFWGININATRNFRRLDDLDTRGGPPIVKPAATSLNLNVNTDSRKSWQLSMGLSGQRDTEDGWSASVGPSLRLQPSPRLQSTISAQYTRARDIAQWITNRDVTGDNVADNIYGTLRRNVLSLTGRATYAFDRDLTVEAFVQPFVAVGDYTDIRRLAAPSSFTFASATLPTNPDFNSKSMRGNVVVRWEYRPGSTIFVVWNMSTFDASRPGEFDALRDLGTAFGADGSQVFMIKINYWLGL